MLHTLKKNLGHFFALSGRWGEGTHSIRVKLFLAFLFVGICSVVITGWQSYSHARSSLELTSFNALTATREIKKRQIEDYFNQITNQILIYAESQTVVDAMRRNLQRNPAPRALGDGSENIDTFRNYHAAFAAFIAKFGFSDLMLIDAGTGAIVYSVLNHIDLNANLLTGPAKSSNLAQAFLAVQHAPGPNFTYLVDFAAYGPNGAEPASFIASPVFDGHRQIGVLAFQLSSREINRIMVGRRAWEEEGLGKSGETYIVGSDGRMRTDSRFIVEQPEAFFASIAHMNLTSGSLRQMQESRSTIGLLEVHTIAAAEALSGKTNTRMIHDYRNVPVLSSYTPLNIKDLRWALISEIDQIEAFAPVFALRERIVLLGVICSLFAAFLGALLSKTVLNPVMMLVEAVEAFGQGDLAKRSKVSSRDEIGLLATSFNRMADSLRQKNLLLENEIAERKGLENALLEISEREQQRIGQDLHDSLAQHLSGLSLFAKSLERKLANTSSKDAADAAKICGLIEKSIGMTHDIAKGLLPTGLEQGDLIYALTELCAEIAVIYNISCQFSCGKEAERELGIAGHPGSVNLFRIVQEAVSNAIKHGQAKHVMVAITRENGEFLIEIRDDGSGFPVGGSLGHRGMGLRIMEARAKFIGAALEISSTSGEGATIRCRLKG